MAVSVSEFKEWVNKLDDDGAIAIDDGGLTVVVTDADGDFSEDGPSFEIGGIPLDEDTDEEN